MQQGAAASCAAADEPALLPLLRAAADGFCDRLRAVPGVQCLAPPPQPPHDGSLRWRNTLFAAPIFRRAHVELLEIPGHFAVVHVVVLPHASNQAPIFGFDIVAGRAQATGVFLDFTPVTQAPPDPDLAVVLPAEQRLQLGTPRELPEWARIFSRGVLAVRPSAPAHVDAAIACALRAFGVYLQLLPACAAGQPDPDVLRGQAAYAYAQRQNPHTRRMLARFVGEEGATVFIENVLFPVQEKAELLF